MLSTSEVSHLHTNDKRSTKWTSDKDENEKKEYSKNWRYKLETTSLSLWKLTAAKKSNIGKEGSKERKQHDAKRGAVLYLAGALPSVLQILLTSGCASFTIFFVVCFRFYYIGRFCFCGSVAASSWYKAGPESHGEEQRSGLKRNNSTITPTRNITSQISSSNNTE